MNKAFLAILIAVLYFILSGMFTDSVFEEQKITSNSYPIEVASAKAVGTGEKSVVSKAPSMAELLQTADLAAGKKAFKVCKTCHTTEKGGKTVTGPNLWNILGRKKAAVAGFSYSSAMAEKGGNWAYDDLYQFLEKPKDFIKKTKMIFAGVKKKKKRANLIAYLRSLSDSPAALPAVEAAPETENKD